MKKILVFILLFGLLFTGCQKKIAMTDLPEAVKIVKKSGVTIRSSWEKEFKPVGAALQGYTYKVVDGDPAYYRIVYVDGSEGWISAGYDKNWTERTADGKVKILVKGGITVRQKAFDNGSKVVGVAAEKYSFPVTGVEYYYLKIEFPEGKQGWIYVGTPEDRWIEPVKAGTIVKSDTEDGEGGTPVAATNNP